MSAFLEIVSTFSNVPLSTGHRRPHGYDIALGDRSRELCREVVRRGQALVTTAHRDWIEALDDARVYEVADGRVRAA